MGVHGCWTQLLALEKRLETLAVVHFLFIWIILPLMALWLPLYITLFTPYWWITLLYCLWFVYDYETPRRGSRPTQWCRNWKVWALFARYFPLTLVKTAELPPDRNYIIGCHPHGVFSIGAFTSLCTNATNFPCHFPGLNSTLLTLGGQFLFPLRREIGILLGGSESSGRSLKWLLQHPGHGRAIGIVIGGAEEALDAHPGRHRINLAMRRGFIRYALKYGYSQGEGDKWSVLRADLVPMYSFGENECYAQIVDNELGTRLRRVQVFDLPFPPISDLQTAIKSRFGFCPPLIRGRGIFNYAFGLLPHRRAITSVMGAPIPVETTIEEPTPEQLNELHARYCCALVQLFETHKAQYGVPDDVHLDIY